MVLPGAPLDPAVVAAGIRHHAEGLAQFARSAGLRELAYLLGIVAEEARRKAAQARLPEPDEPEQD